MFANEGQVEVAINLSDKIDKLSIHWDAKTTQCSFYKSLAV